jgi:hypothetical protein
MWATVIWAWPLVGMNPKEYAGVEGGKLSSGLKFWRASEEVKDVHECWMRERELRMVELD